MSTISRLGLEYSVRSDTRQDRSDLQPLSEHVRNFIWINRASSYVAGRIVILLLALPMICAGGQETAEDPKSGVIRYINPEGSLFQLPMYAGKRYQAKVPDTLDLAERAALAVNGLTGPTDPAADYELYWLARFVHNPPYLSRDFSDHMQAQFMESLPLMRVASGSQQSKDVEWRWLEVLMQMRGPDGLLHYSKVGRPWALAGQAPEQFGAMPEGDYYSEPYVNGRLLGAIGIYYQLTGDERWKKLGQQIVDGLARQAIQREDYAYFSKGLFAVNERSDPKVTMESIDPWTNMTFGWIALGLAQFYKSTDFAPALELSGKLARYIRKHGRLYDAEGRFINIGGHFHGHTYPLLGMIEYATAASDWEMVQFVRKGFEFGIPGMHSMIGFVPEYINSPDRQISETCGVADMIALALKLTEAGAGDYWDDVDRWTRNQFAENQLTDASWVDAFAKSQPDTPVPDFTGPQYSTDRIAARCLGGFAGWPTANDWQGVVPEGSQNGDRSIMACCTGKGSRAIYYVWENIITHRNDGRLTVNLLLNRASPWADVQSRIPYEGCVEVQMKQPCELAIRIPEWTAPQDIRCFVNDKPVEVKWEGRFAVIGQRRAADRVTMQFPIGERTDRMTINGAPFEFTRKGNNVVHVEPQGRIAPLYQQAAYRQNETRWRTVERFVADRWLDW